MGQILRGNCLPKHVILRRIEGRIEGTGRRVRRCGQILNALKEKAVNWKLKEEVLVRNLWRTRFGSGYGPVVRRTAG